MQSVQIDRKLNLSQMAQVTVRAQNKSGYEVWAGETVCLDTTNTAATNICFTSSYTISDHTAMGMALETIGKDEYGQILKEGPTDLLKVDGNANIAAGDKLEVIDGATYADYTTGTVGVASGGTAVTGSGTTFTAAMKGRKIRFASETTTYKIITFTSTTAIVISPAYRETAALVGGTYNISAKGIAEKATAGYGGVFARAGEAYTTNDSYGAIIAYITGLAAGFDVVASTIGLDDAYDKGGTGAGRAITVDQNAVDLNGNEATENILEISNSDGAATGSLIDLDNANTATKDINGTGDTWSVTGAGALTVASLDAGSGAITTTGALTVGSFDNPALTGNLVLTEDATTNVGCLLDGDTVTTGVVLRIDYAAPLTTGTALQIRDGTTHVFSIKDLGATTILGSAAGTDALTITKGDVFLSDGKVLVEEETGTTTVVTIDAKAGVMASGEALLHLDAGGNVASGSNMIRIEPTGTPVEGSIGIEFVGSTKLMQALAIDCDNVTNSSVLINSGGAKASNKAVLEVTADGNPASGGNVVRITASGSPNAGAIVLEIDAQKDCAAVYIDSDAAASSAVTITGQGVVASNKAMLDIINTGNVANGGNMIRITPSGTPVEGSVGIEFVGTGKLMQALNIDCDNVANSCVLLQGGGALDADKAVLEITADGAVKDGGNVLRVAYTGAPAAATTKVVEIVAAVDCQTLYIESSAATESAVTIAGVGAIAADKAILHVTQATGTMVADGAMVRIEGATAAAGAGDSFGLLIACNGTNLEGLYVELGESFFAEHITIETTSKLQFRDTATFINSPAANKIEIEAAAAGDDDILLDGGVTIGTGHNLVLTSGNATLTSGNLVVTSGSATMTLGDLVMTAGFITFAAGCVKDNITAKTATATLTTAEAGIVTVDSSGGATTLTLPAASGNTGLRYIIKHIVAGTNLVVDPNAAETIDGAATKTSGTQYNLLDIVCDGSNWIVLSYVGTWT